MACYSRNHNAVYIHEPKVGGLYIDFILNHEDDFVTYNFNQYSDIHFYHDRDTGIRSEFHRNCEKFLIDRTSLKTCFEFTFVRSPYTRFISAYFYCKGIKVEDTNTIFGYHMDTLQDCIDNRDLLTTTSWFHIFKTQYKHIEFTREMDFIGRFENLIADLQYVFKKLGLNPNFSRKKINENPIKYGDYRQYYTQEILDFVNEHFDIDFVKFGYKKVYNVEDLVSK